jgi:hypothetical protein
MGRARHQRQLAPAAEDPTRVVGGPQRRGDAGGRAMSGPNRETRSERVLTSRCGQCGEPFAPARPHQRFCRPSCRLSHFKVMRQPALPLTHLNCDTTYSKGTLNKSAGSVSTQMSNNPEILATKDDLGYTVKCGQCGQPMQITLLSKDQAISAVLPASSQPAGRRERGVSREVTPARLR